MMNSSEIMSMMEFLKWKEVSTKRQRKNGTQIFELPIKGGRGCTNIKVGSFKSGYVRRMNHCYTPYQLNKCKPYTEYVKSYKSRWEEGEYIQEWDGKYNRYTGKQRIVISDEVDRLNYLISYCLKNFYIGHANQVANGKFIPKWEHEWRLEQASKDEGFYSRQNDDLKRQLALLNGTNYSPKDVQVIIDGQRYKII